MSKDDILALIHGEIDGINSEADSALLRAHLAENPQDERRFGELRQVVTALNSAAEIEPTTGLRDKILGSIAWPKRNRWADLVASLRPSPPVLKLGFAFALGSVVAILGMQLSPELGLRSAGDMNDMAGAMVRHGPAANRDELDIIQIDTEHVTGSVAAHQIDGLQVVEVDLLATGELELVAEPSKDFQLEAVVRRGEHFPSISRTGDTVVAAGRGEHRYALLLRSNTSADGDVRIRLYSAKELIREDTLPLISQE